MLADICSSRGKKHQEGFVAFPGAAIPDSAGISSPWNGQGLPLTAPDWLLDPAKVNKTDKGR